MDAFSGPCSEPVTDLSFSFHVASPKAVKSGKQTGGDFGFDSDEEESFRPNKRASPLRLVKLPVRSG